MNILNKFGIHKHNYIETERCIVHYPDYEPHKVGIVYICTTCLKEKRKLYKPYDFIKMFGRQAYDSLLK